MFAAQLCQVSVHKNAYNTIVNCLGVIVSLINGIIVTDTIQQSGFLTKTKPNTQELPQSCTKNQYGITGMLSDISLKFYMTSN